jgi:Flp pilus assembly protein TadG
VPSKVSRRRIRIRRRDEGGAVAIITAMMCVVLFGIAALSVDLGNAFTRRTDTQTQADYGALAAARLQTETAKSGMPIPTPMVDAVRDAMNANQPQDDASSCWTSKSCVTSAQLVDNNLVNGEIRYCSGTTCGSGYASTVKGLQVTAPRNKVQYGFARVLGVQNGNVTADALVNVFTAGQRVMPMYAVQGCDYGLQTLADPASGHTTPVVPTLAFDTDTNTTQITALSQELKDSTGAVVSSLTYDSTGNTVSFEASRWVNATKIGFFRGDDPLPGLVQEVSSYWLESNVLETNIAPYTENNARTVQLNIPDAVADVQTVWWIRVYNATTNQWSPKGEALGVRVGEAVLECDAGSDAGNFGTLKFPRTDVPTGNEIPANMATGLQLPLTAEVHPWALANPGLAGLCTDGTNGAVVSSGTNLRPGTNCVDTDTGLAANMATEGLVLGGTYGSGVLRTQATRPGCDPQGGNNDRNLNFGSTTYSVNDDVLSCYFIDGGTSIADIAKASYSGGVAFIPEILKSPRFFYVPVLAIQPTTGGSETYSIIDFRAAFLTDETATNTAIKGSKTGTNNNGVVVQGNDIKQLKVVFFNDAAIPVDGDIPLIDYLGTGNRVIRLID